MFFKKDFLSSKALFQTQIPWKITSVVPFIMSYVDIPLVNKQILFCFIIWVSRIQPSSLAPRGIELSILNGALDLLLFNWRIRFAIGESLSSIKPTLWNSVINFTYKFKGILSCLHP